MAQSLICFGFVFPTECSDILDQKLQSNWSRGKGSGQPFEEIHQKTRGKKTCGS